MGYKHGALAAHRKEHYQRKGWPGPTYFGQAQYSPQRPRRAIPGGTPLACYPVQKCHRRRGLINRLPLRARP